MEMVDVLVPPTFAKSGVVKPLQQAWADQDWIGTFNLWILQNSPVPAIVYQVRSKGSSWGPGKLDVTAGGHYQAGEEISDGLREEQEELGKTYAATELTYLGKKLHISPDIKGKMRHNVVDINFVVDNSPLSSFNLEPKEVSALAILPIKELKKIHSNSKYSFTIMALDSTGVWFDLQISQASFPYNWDNYHYKTALLAERFLKGEDVLIY